MRRAFFLDRDGVINATVWNSAESVMDSPYRWEEFRLLAGAATAVRLLNRLGFLAVVVSNQPGVAKGKCGPEFLEELNRSLQSSLREHGAQLDAIYYCLHHPEARVASLCRVCDCRKPRPGLILRAARELDIDVRASFMVGDSERDVQAGLAAGCRTIFVGDGPLSGARPHLVAQDLLDAVRRAVAALGEEVL